MRKPGGIFFYVTGITIKIEQTEILIKGGIRLKYENKNLKVNPRIIGAGWQLHINCYVREGAPPQ